MVEDASQVIGWQGISISVPADWSLTGFGGDARSGSMRLDSARADSKTVPIGLEVRWLQQKKTPNAQQIGQRLKELLAAVEKTAKREKTTAETWSGECVENVAQERPAQLAFRWKAGSAASGRIWYCATCGRVVIVQVYGRGGPRFLEHATQILDSIGCHGTEIGWRSWALYGLETSAPATYTLSGQQVMNIYLQLSFRQEKAEETLSIEQWSLANVQLKGQYLDEWFAVKAGSSLANVDYEKIEDEVAGHSALRMTGRRGGIIYWLSDGLRDLIRFRMPATYYDALLWECPESNKAYLVQTFSRSSQQALVRDIADRTRCHAG
ncbi:MAG: hypothetical protein P4L33_15935 [Capsulimonadaceae bacterium]|nr:hypothetical protein [Capsulimonadaceae bacterium]